MAKQVNLKRYYEKEHAVKSNKDIEYDIDVKLHPEKYQNKDEAYFFAHPYAFAQQNDRDKIAIIKETKLNEKAPEFIKQVNEQEKLSKGRKVIDYGDAIKRWENAVKENDKIKDWNGVELWEDTKRRNNVTDYNKSSNVNKTVTERLKPLKAQQNYYSSIAGYVHTDEERKKSWDRLSQAEKQKWIKSAVIDDDDIDTAVKNSGRKDTLWQMTPAELTEAKRARKATADYQDRVVKQIQAQKEKQKEEILKGEKPSAKKILDGDNIFSGLLRTYAKIFNVATKINPVYAAASSNKKTKKMYESVTGGKDVERIMGKAQAISIINKQIRDLNAYKSEYSDNGWGNKIRGRVKGALDNVGNAANELLYVNLAGSANEVLAQAQFTDHFNANKKKGQSDTDAAVNARLSLDEGTRAVFDAINNDEYKAMLKDFTQSNAYNGGVSAAMSAPLMVTFMTYGGLAKGAAKMGAKKLAAYEGKNFAKKSLGKMSKFVDYAANASLKAGNGLKTNAKILGGKTVENLASSGVVTALAPQVYENLMQAKVDKLRFGDSNHKELSGNEIFNIIADTYIENYSEMGLTKWIDALKIPMGKIKMPKLFTEGTAGKVFNTVKDVNSKIYRNPFMKFLKNNARVGGVGEEMLEEYYGGGLKYLIGLAEGDDDMKQDWRNLLTKDGFQVLAWSMIPQITGLGMLGGGFHSASNYIGLKDYRNAKNDLLNLTKKFSNINLGDLTTGIEAMVANTAQDKTHRKENEQAINLMLTQVRNTIRQRANTSYRVNGQQLDIDKMNTAFDKYKDSISSLYSHADALSQKISNMTPEEREKFADDTLKSLTQWNMNNNMLNAFTTARRFDVNGEQKVGMVFGVMDNGSRVSYGTVLGVRTLDNGEKAFLIKNNYDGKISITTLTKLKEDGGTVSWYNEGELRNAVNNAVESSDMTEKERESVSMALNNISAILKSNTADGNVQIERVGSKLNDSDYRIVTVKNDNGSLTNVYMTDSELEGYKQGDYIPTSDLIDTFTASNRFADNSAMDVYSENEGADLETRSENRQEEAESRLENRQNSATEDTENVSNSATEETESTNNEDNTENDTFSGKNEGKNDTNSGESTENTEENSGETPEESGKEELKEGESYTDISLLSEGDRITFVADTGINGTERTTHATVISADENGITYTENGRTKYVPASSVTSYIYDGKPKAENKAKEEENTPKEEQNVPKEESAEAKEEDLEAAEEDYYNDLDNNLNVPETEPNEADYESMETAPVRELGEADIEGQETTQSMGDREEEADEEDKALAEIKDWKDNKIEDIKSRKTLLEKENALGEAITVDEFVMRYLANGNVKFRWKDDANNPHIRGLKNYFHWGESERKPLMNMLATQDNGGVSVEHAHELVQMAIRDNMGLDMDLYDVRNLVDEILAIGSTREMMNRAIEMHVNNEVKLLGGNGRISFRVEKRQYTNNNSVNNIKDYNNDGRTEENTERRGVVEDAGALQRTNQTLAEATAESRGDFETDGTSEGFNRGTERLASRAKVLRRIKDLAKKNGVWYDDYEIFTDGNGFVNNGGESLIYNSPDGKFVIKTNNMQEIGSIIPANNIIDFIDRINAHNELFTGTKYEVLGFCESEIGEISIILKQPKIDGVYANEADIRAELERRGFTYNGFGSYSNDKYVLSDANPTNVLTDGNNFYFIDLGVQHKNDSDKKGFFVGKNALGVSDEERFAVESEQVAEEDRADVDAADTLAQDTMDAMFANSGITMHSMSEEELWAKAEEFDAEKVKELATDDGEIYGFTINGEVYINKAIAGSETKMHEFTHIWDMSVRKNNPALWNRGVELMKQTELWQTLKNNSYYKDLNDDDMASECHAILSGKEGAKLMQSMQTKMLTDAQSSDEMMEKLSLMQRLKQWVKDVWTWIKDTQVRWTDEEAKNVSLEEFVNMPIADLINGTRIDNVSDNTARFRAESNSEENAEEDTLVSSEEQALNDVRLERAKAMLKTWWLDRITDRFAWLRKFVKLAAMEGYDINGYNPYEELTMIPDKLANHKAIWVFRELARFRAAEDKVRKKTNMTKRMISDFLLIRAMRGKTAQRLSDIFLNLYEPLMQRIDTIHFLDKRYSKIEEKLTSNYLVPITIDEYLKEEKKKKENGEDNDADIDAEKFRYWQTIRDIDANESLSEEQKNIQKLSAAKEYAEKSKEVRKDIEFDIEGDKTDIDDVEFAKKFYSYYSAVTNEEVEARFNTLTDKKPIDNLKAFKDKIRALIAAERYTDEVEYKVQEYEDGTKLGVKGLNGEMAIHNSELYKRLYENEDIKLHKEKGEEDKEEKYERRTFHSPNEIINDAINKYFATDYQKELLEELTNATAACVRSTTEVRDKFHNISNEEYNRYLLSDKYWLPLRGFDSDTYKTYGFNSAKQKQSIKQVMRTTFPDRADGYIAAMFSTEVEDSVIKQAKMNVVKFFLDPKVRKLLLGTDSTLAYVYKKKGEGLVKKNEMPSEDEIDESLGTEDGEEVNVEMVFLKDGKNINLNSVLDNNYLLFGEKYSKIDPKKLDELTFKFNYNGVKYSIVLPQDAKDLVDSLNTSTLRGTAKRGKYTLPIKILGEERTINIGAFTRFISQFLTSKNPAFIVKNIIRDLITAMWLPNGKYSTWSYRGALLSNVWHDMRFVGKMSLYPKKMHERMRDLKWVAEHDKEAELYTDWMNWLEQGGSSGSVAYHRDITEQIDDFDNMLAEGAWNKTKWVLSFGFMSSFAEWSESLTRFSVYRALKKTHPEASTRELAFQSKEATVNFAVYGTFSRMMNDIVPFFSAAVNGIRRTVYMYENNKSGFWSRVILNVSLGYGNYILMSTLAGDGDDDSLVNRMAKKYFGISIYSRLRGFFVGRFAIPMAQDDYVFYSLGVLAGMIQNKEITKTEALVEWTHVMGTTLPEMAGTLFSDILTYDKADNRIRLGDKDKNVGENILSLLNSTSFGTATQLAFNTNYMDGKIIAENYFGQTKTAAGRNDDSKTMALSEWMSDVYGYLYYLSITGKLPTKEEYNTANESGKVIDNNGMPRPFKGISAQQAEYFFKGFTPPYYQLADLTAEAVGDNGRGGDIWSKLPVFNGFVKPTKVGVDGDMQRFQSSGFALKDAYDPIMKNAKLYTKEQAEKIMAQPEFTLYQYYTPVAKQLNELKKAEKTYKGRPEYENVKEQADAIRDNIMRGFFTNADVKRLVGESDGLSDWKYLIKKYNAKK